MPFRHIKNIHTLQSCFIGNLIICPFQTNIHVLSTVSQTHQYTNKK